MRGVGLDGDGCRGGAGGQHGEQRWGLAGGVADYGDVARGTVGDEEEVLVGASGEGERVGGGADVQAGKPLTVVDGVERKGVGAGVGDPQGAVVGRDDAALRAVADAKGLRDLIGGGRNFGDGAGDGVRDEELSAIGLEDQVFGGFADVEQGEDVVCGERGIVPCGPGVGSGCERERKHLAGSLARDEGL